MTTETKTKAGQGNGRVKAAGAGGNGQGAPPESVDLAALARDIQADLKAAEESSWERLRRYRAAGEKLLRAKKLCPHGAWCGWLSDNFHLTDRQARRYMGYAKTDVTSDLEAEEEQWRRICGNAPAAPRDNGRPRPGANGRAEPRGSAEVILQALRAVAAGLAADSRYKAAQSDCFAFVGGAVVTYNEECGCRAPSPFGDAVEGAVEAKPLLAVLEKLAREGADVEARATDSELVLTSGGQEARLVLHAEILLPYQAVEEPGAWQPLAPDFLGAVPAVGDCAGTDDGRYALTCVHVTPGWVEACDTCQGARWVGPTGFAAPTMLRHKSLKWVPQLGAAEFSETENWVHFKNASGVVLSVRRYREYYRDLSPLLDFEGEPIVWPDGLAPALAKAGTFAKGNGAWDLVRVILRPGEMTVEGKGPGGRFGQTFATDYTGSEREFRIAPGVLARAAGVGGVGVLSERLLRMESGPLRYVAYLFRPERLPVPQLPAPEEYPEAEGQDPQEKSAKEGADEPTGDKGDGSDRERGDVLGRSYTLRFFATMTNKEFKEYHRVWQLLRLRYGEEGLSRLVVEYLHRLYQEHPEAAAAGAEVA